MKEEIIKITPQTENEEDEYPVKYFISYQWSNGERNGFGNHIMRVGEEIQSKEHVRLIQDNMKIFIESQTSLDIRTINVVLMHFVKL